MDLNLTEEQAMIQSMARKFSENELAPTAHLLDKQPGYQGLLANLKKLAELGFMGLNVDAAYGGTEAGTVAFSLAMTEIGRGCAATAATMSVTNMVGELIQAIANKEQKDRYLPKLCNGEFLAGSFCLSEPGAGSDPSAITTKAKLENGEWVLNGAKAWITSAAYAGIFVVWAVTDPAAVKGKGISCFLVERDTPGLLVGAAEKKMGQRASSTNPVICIAGKAQ